MLFLLFELGGSRYAIAAAQVVEVLPLLSLAELPRAPAGVAGAFDYHGVAVPVVDLGELVLGRPAARRLSTRIVLVRSRGAAPGCGAEAGLVGLVAERATQMLSRAAGELQAPDARVQNTAWLGRVLPDPGGLIQWIEVDALLPDSLLGALGDRGSARAESPRH